MSSDSDANGMSKVDWAVTGLSFAGSLVSTLGAAFILITYAILPRLKKHFRHVLIWNLAAADFIGALNDTISGGWKLGAGHDLRPGGWCTFNGWVTQLSVQGTDTAIFAIAIVTVWTVTRGRIMDEVWSPLKIVLVIASVWALPIATSFAVLAKGWYGPVSGNWCWIVESPKWARYIFTHGWRFVFIVIEIGLYVYLYLYLRRRHRGVTLAPSRALSVDGEKDTQSIQESKAAYRIPTLIMPSTLNMESRFPASTPGGTGTGVVGSGGPDSSNQHIQIVERTPSQRRAAGQQGSGAGVNTEMSMNSIAFANDKLGGDTSYVQQSFLPTYTRAQEKEEKAQAKEAGSSPHHHHFSMHRNNAGSPSNLSFGFSTVDESISMHSMQFNKPSPTTAVPPPPVPNGSGGSGAIPLSAGTGTTNSYPYSQDSFLPPKPKRSAFPMPSKALRMLGAGPGSIRSGMFGGGRRGQSHGTLSTDGSATRRESDEAIREQYDDADGGAQKARKGQTFADVPRASVLSRFGLIRTRNEQVHDLQPDLARAEEQADAKHGHGKGKELTHGTPHSTSSSDRSRRSIQRVLLLNAYPTAYIILWIPGIANRFVELAGHESAALQILQASTQFVGLANALTYGWNESVAANFRRRFFPNHDDV